MKTSALQYGLHLQYSHRSSAKPFRFQFLSILYRYESRFFHKILLSVPLPSDMFWLWSCPFKFIPSFPVLLQSYTFRLLHHRFPAYLPSLRQILPTDGIKFLHQYPAYHCNCIILREHSYIRCGVFLLLILLSVAISIIVMPLSYLTAKSL